MAASDIFGKLYNPVPTVMLALEALERQLNLEYASITPSDGALYGTFTASRRNAKPFIVGFIPPDNEVNFIPISPAFNPLSSISNSSGVQAPESVSVGTRIGTGNDGLIKRVAQQPNVDEIRQLVYDQFLKQTGVAPLEATLRLIVSHMVAERGPAYGNPPRIPTVGFNLTNTHGSGEGTYLPEYRSRASRKGKSADFGIENPPKTPAGGTYYLGTDFDRENQAYPIYYTAFTSLDASVAYQVNMLIRGWPRAGVATTEEEFIDALLNTPGHAPFFEAKPGFYTGVLKRATSWYDTRYGDSPLGTVSGPKIPPGDDNPRSIMRYGIDANDSDPLSSEYGRNIQLANEQRQRIVSVQTEALRRQIEIIKAVPPLILLINPSSFVRRYTASSDTSVKGRYGNIVHNWLEKPFPIESEGVTAGQYVVNAEGAGGVTSNNRIHSLSYANLLSLVGMYKNNGNLFAGSESDPGVPVLGMSLYIYYDEHIYIGSFDSFGVDDSADKPNNLSYEFKFNVRYDLPTDGLVFDKFISSGLPF